MKHVDIAIASSSVIVTTGLAAILAKLRNIHVTVKEIDPERIDEQLNKLKPLILIVDPLTIDAQKVKELKSTSPSRMFIIAVQYRPARWHSPSLRQDHIDLRLNRHNNGHTVATS